MLILRILIWASIRKLVSEQVPTNDQETIPEEEEMEETANIDVHVGP